MSKPYIPANPDFIEAGMNAWNILSEYFDQDGSSPIYTNTSDFEEFYNLVMDKILEEEEAE